MSATLRKHGELVKPPSGPDISHHLGCYAPTLLRNDSIEAGPLGDSIRVAYRHVSAGEGEAVRYDLPIGVAAAGKVGPPLKFQFGEVVRQTAVSVLELQPDAAVALNNRRKED